MAKYVQYKFMSIPDTDLHILHNLNSLESRLLTRTLSHCCSIDVYCVRYIDLHTCQVHWQTMSKGCALVEVSHELTLEVM